MPGQLRPWPSRQRMVLLRLCLPTWTQEPPAHLHHKLGGHGRSPPGQCCPPRAHRAASVSTHTGSAVLRKAPWAPPPKPPMSGWVPRQPAEGRGALGWGCPLSPTACPGSGNLLVPNRPAQNLSSCSMNSLRTGHRCPLCSSPRGWPTLSVPCPAFPSAGSGTPGKPAGGHSLSRCSRSDPGGHTAGDPTLWPAASLAPSPGPFREQPPGWDASPGL